MTSAEERLPAIILKRALILLSAAGLAGFLLCTPRVGYGILAGGIIVIINFLWLRSTLRQTLQLLPGNPSRYAFIRFIGRICVTGFLLYICIVSGYFSIAGIIIGLSIIVTNIMGHTAYSAYSALRAGG